jgi:hypothetical protein
MNSHELRGFPHSRDAEGPSDLGPRYLGRDGPACRASFTLPDARAALDTAAGGAGAPVRQSARGERWTRVWAECCPGPRKRYEAGHRGGPTAGAPTGLVTRIQRSYPNRRLTSLPTRRGYKVFLFCRCARVAWMHAYPVIKIRSLPSCGIMPDHVCGRGAVRFDSGASRPQEYQPNECFSRLRRLACGIGLPAMVVTMGWIGCCLLSGIPKVLFVTRREPGLV